MIVDDDVATLKFISAYLRGNNYKTETVSNGEDAIPRADSFRPDLVLLDIMLPGLDGYTICQQLREWSRIPIIMVSALHDVAEKVRCLSIGADDYLCKPFNLEELLARIEAVLRRYDNRPLDKQSATVFRSGDLEIDFLSRQVSVHGTNKRLTSKEYALLKELALNSPRVLTYQLILQKVWGAVYGNERNYLYAYISRLRKLLERDPSKPTHILSTRDIGYYMK